MQNILRHPWYTRFVAFKPGVSDSQLALRSAWHQVRNLPETHLLTLGSKKDHIIPLRKAASFDLWIQALSPPQMNLINPPSRQQLGNLECTS